MRVETLLQETGLILAPGPAGRCDDFRVGGAVVDLDSVSGLWRMWYYGRDRAFAGAPPTLGSGRVAYATSKDGVAWDRYPGAMTGGSIFEPSEDPSAFDSLHLGVNDVTRWAGQWLMWYFGGDASVRGAASPMLGGVPGIPMRLGLALSQDGISWRRVPGATPSGALFELEEDELYASWPNVFHDGRRFIMQYTSPSLNLDRFRTRIATSSDGVHWEKHGALIWLDQTLPYDAGGMVIRRVMPNPTSDGDRWLMIYTAIDATPDHNRSVAAAHSADGMHWRRLYGRPIFQRGPSGAWDSGGASVTHMVAVNDSLYLYYYGFQDLDVTKPRGVGLAISGDGDLRNFVRYGA